jgi:hypothetical protein
MARKSDEINASKAVPRESDNPIVEDFKEELLNRPTYGAQTAAIDDARLCRLEGLLAEMNEKVEDQERRLKALEN